MDDGYLADDLSMPEIVCPSWCVACDRDGPLLLADLDRTLASIDHHSGDMFGPLVALVQYDSIAMDAVGGLVLVTGEPRVWIPPESEDGGSSWTVAEAAGVAEGIRLALAYLDVQPAT
jgi:hypothetical protein